jgi:lactoylglutathione lyase
MEPQQSKHPDDVLQLPQAQYLVLRVADINASAQFFSLLGFNPIQEQHGSGPEHFSFRIHGDLVLELYPWNKETSPPTNFARFGLLVPSMSEIRNKLSVAQIPVTRESSAGANREWILVLDPDGNQVEISEHPGIR